MGNTILLADKSITIQKIVELTFTEDQFEVKCVSDGQAALDLIPQIRPDIVLADISLPLKTGYEVCSAIRTDPAYASFSQVPVILLAGIYETMDEERAKQVAERVKEVGANDLLSKPFDPQLLTAKVKELVRKPVASHYEDQRLSPGSFSFESPDNPFLATDSYQPPHSTDDTGRFDVIPEQPADDSERTMILPGPPTFSSGDIFAQSPPFEPEDTVAQNTRMPDLDSIKPVNEPVFEAGEMENEVADQLFNSMPEREEGQQEEQQSSESLFDTGEISSTGVGWPEKEFEMPGSYGDTEQAPVNLMGGEDQESSPTYGSPDSPPLEEPFGDMLSEPASESVSWGGFSAFSGPEDESPFGLPEPSEKSVELHIEENIISPVAEENIASEYSINPEQMPVPEEPSLDFKPEPEEPVLDFKAEPEESETPPADNIDTWSPPAEMMIADEQVVAPPEPAAEESRLYSQPESNEEAEELQPDLAEAGFTPDVPGKQAEEAPAVAASNFNPAQISDEFIDRIVEKVLAKISAAIISDVVWQVVPDLAEKMIRRELEKLHAGEED
jgi:CheY-like chemotaxis protein